MSLYLRAAHAMFVALNCQSESHVIAPIIQSSAGRRLVMTKANEKDSELQKLMKRSGRRPTSPCKLCELSDEPPPGVLNSAKEYFEAVINSPETTSVRAIRKVLQDVYGICVAKDVIYRHRRGDRCGRDE